MKLYIATILMGLIGFFHVSVANAQCDPATSIDTCIPILPDGFIFLKGYEVNNSSGSKSQVEYSYPFAKDTQYVINICTGSEAPSGIVITLMDYSRRELASSKIDGQYVSAIIFNCKATGIYYIKYTLENNVALCGGSVLGFKK